SIKLRIVEVLVVVRLALLANRVRRVANNDADVELLLPLSPGAVIDHELGEQVIPLVHLESVGQTDAFEGLVFAADDAVLGSLSIARRDVVSENDDFFRVDLLAIFSRQVFW